MAQTVTHKLENSNMIEECICEDSTSTAGQVLPVVVVVQNEPRLPARNRRKDDCNFAPALLIIFTILGLGALGFGGYGYYKEFKWNDVVDGLSSFPSIPNCKYFEGKTFRLNSSEHESLRLNLKRDGRRDLVFLVVTFLYLVPTLGLICFYQKPIRFNPWFMLGALVNTMNGMALLAKLGGGYASQYKIVYTELERYSNTSAGSLNPIALEESTILRNISDVCRKYPTDMEYRSVLAGDEICGLAQLSELGFCQHYISKAAAIFFALLLGLTCLVTFLSACFCNCCAEEEEVALPASLVYLQRRNAELEAQREAELQLIKAYIPVFPPLDEEDYDSINSNAYSDPRQGKATWRQWERKVRDLNSYC